MEKIKKKKVFLGGTWNNSTWRDKIIPQLTINYFNPIVNDWDEKAQKEELKQRKNCDYCLYVITPEMEGVYSIAEVVDDSNKRPGKTILTLLREANGKKFTDSQWKSLKQVGAMVKGNGAKLLYGLIGTVEYLNNECK